MTTVVQDQLRDLRAIGYVVTCDKTPDGVVRTVGVTGPGYAAIANTGVSLKDTVVKVVREAHAYAFGRAS